MFGAFQFAAAKFADAPLVAISPDLIVSVQGWAGRSPRVPYDVFLRDLARVHEREESEEIVTVLNLWLLTQN